MHLSEGTLLQGGKYSIIRCLGQGGFGITYLAWQSGLERQVVIKEFFMNQYCDRDATTSRVSFGTESNSQIVARFLDKFLKEARNIAALRHFNIVSIHSIFEENNTAYYVMDYHSYGSLGAFVGGKEKLSEERAVRYIRQIASALKYIHARRILHLDIKPDNILLDENDNAILIDFGISKVYDRNDAIKAHTSTFATFSPGYAPIEQYSPEGVKGFSPATDIYSLGATLYALLSGVTPPRAGDILMDGLTPLPETVSLSTRAAVYKAMLPKVNDRPQSIDEFLALLDEEVVLDDNNVTNSTVAINSNNASSSTAAANSSTVAANRTVEKTKVITGNNNSASTDESNQPRKPFNWKVPAGIVATLLCILLAGFGVKEYNDSRAEQAAEKARLAAIEQARLDSISKYYSPLRIACVKNSDGSLHYFTVAEWEANSAKSSYNKLGVLLRDNGREFIIAAKDCADSKGNKEFMFGAYRVNIAGVQYHTDNINRDNIWTGKEDTRAIINATKGKKDKYGTIGAPAAEAAWNYKACSNDPLQWYLPSISELLLIKENRNKINNFLDKYFGGGSIADGWYWSSTSYDSYLSWYVYMNYGYSISTNLRYNSIRVRPVAVAK